MTEGGHRGGAAGWACLALALALLSLPACGRRPGGSSSPEPPAPLPSSASLSPAEQERLERLAHHLEAPLAAQLSTLERYPSLLATEPRKGEPLILVEVVVEEGDRARFLESEHLIVGTLDEERERAAGLVEAPDYWVVLADPETGRLLYWTPVSGVGRVRIETWNDRGRREMSGVDARQPSDPAAVLLPWREGAALAVVAGEALEAPSLHPGSLRLLGPVPDLEGGKGAGGGEP